MFQSYNKEIEVEKALDKFFGYTSSSNYELREALKMKMLGKVDENKLKELEECRKKDLEYIESRYEYKEAIMMEPIAKKPDAYKSSNGF